MPLQIPEEQAVVRQTQSYVRSELPELDPSTQKANFITGIVVALAKTLVHFYILLKDFADRQVHPQTATGSVLFRGWWTALTNMQRTPVTAASGHIVLPGTEGAIIPLGTRFGFSNIDYVTDSSATVLEHSIRASSLTHSDGVAIFEASEPHFLANGLTVVISGAEDAAYNGEYVITVTADNEFTYKLSSTPIGVAGVNTFATSTHALLYVTSETNGQDTNLDGGAVLIETAVNDVESEALLTFGGITGGANLEEQEDFRDRLLDALGSTLGAYTGDEVRDYAKNVPGVTRVWVRKAKRDPEEGWPDEGQAKILFLRDNDANPIPSAKEINDVKTAIADQLLTAHSDDEDLIVIGPNPVSVDIRISDLKPDTASMRLAITENLKQFFDENVSLAADIPLKEHEDLALMDLKCAVKNTVDLETGSQVRSFTLVGPTIDVELGLDDIPTLGQVSFET